MGVELLELKGVWASVAFEEKTGQGNAALNLYLQDGDKVLVGHD